MPTRASSINTRHGDVHNSDVSTTSRSRRLDIEVNNLTEEQVDEMSEKIKNR